LGTNTLNYAVSPNGGSSSSICLYAHNVDIRSANRAVGVSAYMSFQRQARLPGKLVKSCA